MTEIIWAAAAGDKDARAQLCHQAACPPAVHRSHGESVIARPTPSQHRFMRLACTGDPSKRYSVFLTIV